MKVYIDGFNLYHAIDKIGDSRLKWIGYHTLGKSLLRAGEALAGVSLFTAVWPYDQAKHLRHRNFIAAQRHFGVRVHEGNFVKPKKYCVTHDRYCAFREEKQADVGIAVEIVSDALTKAADRIVLITADSDQIPTGRFITSLPDIKITLYAPPNRAQEARELGKLVTDRDELSIGRLLTCQMPDDIVDERGIKVASKPAIYRP
ncbi:MAG: NYN domain-containing protein [Aestuariivirgaceae bacterium]|nr:NYN domain-containing protein [Aestuariivirgaceae bacterium]